MSLVCDVKVVPRASNARCTIAKSGMLTCYVKSAPEQNKANVELITIFARALKIPARQVTIIAGATSRKKRIKIETDVSLDQLYAALGIEQQHSFL